MRHLLGFGAVFVVAAAFVAATMLTAARYSGAPGASAALQPLPATPRAAAIGAGLPDLIPTGIGTANTGTFCDQNYSVTVTIWNNGDAAAGSFIVDLNGVQQTVDGLAAGAQTTLAYPQEFWGTLTATADITNLVVESDETNNELTTPVPIPTLPAQCTPTPTVTPTP